MPTLHLIKFKPPLAGLPKGTAHWALFLLYDEQDSVGLLYSVKKESFISNKTEFSVVDFDPQTASDVLSCVALTEISIKHHILSEICYKVSEGRPFNLISRNCQHWVCEVIEKISLATDTTEVGEKVIRRIKSMK